MNRPDLDAIVARVKPVPQVIPHFPQDDGSTLLCLADDYDTDVGRLWPVGRGEDATPMHALATLIVHARTDLPALVAYARELEANARRAAMAMAAILDGNSDEDAALAACAIAVLGFDHDSLDALRAASVPA